MYCIHLPWTAWMMDLAPSWRDPSTPKGLCSCCCASASSPRPLLSLLWLLSRTHTFFFFFFLWFKCQPKVERNYNRSLELSFYVSCSHLFTTVAQEGAHKRVSWDTWHFVGAQLDAWDAYIVFVHVYIASQHWVEVKIG